MLKVNSNLFFLLILIFSLLGEFIQVPLLEINQIIIIVYFFIYILPLKVDIGSKIKKRIILSFAVFLYVSVSLSTFGDYGSIDNLLHGIISYGIALIFIVEILNLSRNDYDYIVNKISIIAVVVFALEYILGRMNSSLYLYLFLPPADDVRAMANFLSPNSYAIIIAFIIIYWILFYFNSNKFKKKVLALISVVILLFPFFNTSSKSGLIILFLGFVLVAILKKNYVLILIVAFIVAGGIIYLDRLIDLMQNADIYYFRRIALFFNSDSVLGERDNFYKLQFITFSQSPITGCGFNSSIDALSSTVGINTWPHNEYLKILIECGILGFIPFIVFIYNFVYGAYNVSKQINNYDLCIYIILFLASLLFANYFTTYREGIIMIFYSFGIFTRYTSKQLNLNTA